MDLRGAKRETEGEARFAAFCRIAVVGGEVVVDGGGERETFFVGVGGVSRTVGAELACGFVFGGKDLGGNTINTS